MCLFKKKVKEKPNLNQKESIPYERLLLALEMEKENIIKAFEKQGEIKKCKINFTYDSFNDYYKINIEIKKKNETNINKQ